MINSPIIYKFFKDFTKHRKKTNKALVFSSRSFLNLLKYRDQQEKQESFRPLLKHSASMYESSGSLFLRTTTGTQSGPDLINEGSLLTILGVTKRLCSFRLVLEGKISKEIPESSKLEFLEKFLANNFAISDAEDNTSRSLNRVGTADLPLLRTLVAIHQISSKPSLWEVIASLLACASLTASRTLLQQFLTCLDFTLDSEDLFCWYRQKTCFYELWQEQKHLKTMNISEV